MAQGNGHRVGGIVGLGHRGQVENAFGHIHYLMLAGIAVAHHGLLDLHGLVFKHRNICLLTTKKNLKTCSILK